MKPYYEQDGVTVHLGDCRQVLALIPDGSVQTVITSPPYFGLRNYNVDGQIGLENTVEAYVAEMVAVFREVRRVLKDDATVWLNLGDTYASAWPCNRRNVVGSGSLENGKRENRPPRMPDGLKEKDLIGIPWRVAFALQADGWYLRQDIIWAKPNPMPESVNDRCTKSHEYVFLLSKGPRYYFDAQAIAENFAGVPYVGKQNGAITNGDRKDRGKTIGMTTDKRNKRSVWTIATQSTNDAHFATFPRKLVEPCILAGSRPGDVVLDPFAGSGTTLQVAKHLGRRAVGIELNPDYLPMIARRLQQSVLPIEVPV